MKPDSRGYWFPRLAAVSAVVLLLVVPGAAFAAKEVPFPVQIRVDANVSLGELKPIWRFFGADEPNYATMKDGQRLLGELGALQPKGVYFRAHNLLTSGDGTPAFKWGSTNAYTEDAQGNPIYDWRILDLIFDSYLERGVRPYVQIGFMPQALSTHPLPYRHEWRPGLPYLDVFTGWAHPPKSYQKWGDLAYEWTKHSVERYGEQEVQTWYWQTWNEANLGGPGWGGYFSGSDEEFYKLHDYAIAGVRRALPTARVGGPDAAGISFGAPWTDWFRNFLEHSLRGKNFATGGIGTPLDFISFHAKGEPSFQDGHIRMGIAAHLRAIDEGFDVIASFPELKNKPIVLGESDPEGCAACQGPEFSYRNGTVYSSYTAASFARKHDLADRHGVNLEGALSWSFTFEDQPYFAGFRQLASNGVPLPVFNIIRMFAKMSGVRVATESTASVSLDDIMQDGVRKQADVSAFASYDAQSNRLAVMVWHYHDDDLPGPDAAVTLTLSGLPAALGAQAKLSHYRVDQEHGNAYARWLRMGSPPAPDREQYARLLQASELTQITGDSETQDILQGSTQLSLDLPRQGVSLLVLEQ